MEHVSQKQWDAFVTDRFNRHVQSWVEGAGESIARSENFLPDVLTISRGQAELDVMIEQARVAQRRRDTMAYDEPMQRPAVLDESRKLLETLEQRGEELRHLMARRQEDLAALVHEFDEVTKLITAMNGVLNVRIEPIITGGATGGLSGDVSRFQSALASR